MTTAAPTTFRRGEFARALRASPAMLGAIAVLALWFLRRPYLGVWHDARLYMGRGLADLDPAGVGADLFFKYDVQSSFSVFPRIVDALIPIMGWGQSALFLTALGLILWVAALAQLARGFAGGRLYWAVLVAVAASRGSYGAYEILHYAESFPTPRPFAEAAVLSALSALLAGAYGRMLLLLAVATLFHPVMAAAGVGVVWFDLSIRDRRWLWLAPLSLGLAIGAGLAGIAPFTHLYERYDPQWLLVLRLRSSYLFPSMWDEAAYVRILVQCATLAFAAHIVSSRLRAFFLAVLAAGSAGLAISYVFGDASPLLLVVQAQCWRSLWLTALFGVIAMCLCISRLWTEGPAGRAALALFVIAWMGPEAYESAALCLAAIAVYACRRAIAPRLAQLCAYGLGGVAALFVIGALGVDAFAAFKAWREAAPLRPSLALLFSATPFAPTLICVATLLWANDAFRLSQRFLTACAALLSVFAGLGWNAAAPFERALDDNLHPPELETMLATHPGDVLWVGENEAPWLWLGRANWVSYAQGGGAVFSRPLAMAWADRSLALRENEWIEPGVLEPARRKGAVEVALPQLTRERVTRICDRPDGPAWILAGVKSPLEAPAELKAQFWRNPPKFAARRDANGERLWDEVKATAVIDCSAFRR